MNRRAALGLVAGAVTLTGLSGCVHDGEWSVEKVLGWDDKPRAPKMTAASLETAKRVNDLGQRIIEQNTFTGLSPLYHCVGVPESVLFHRGTAELFISEGLVKRCKTDEQLAAVMCSELGQMMAEKQTARGLGRETDAIPEVKQPATTGGFDPAKGTEVAYENRPTPRTAKADGPADPTALAKQLLRGSGFDPAELDKAEPLLKQSDRGDALRKQMAGTAPAPEWKK